VIESREGGESFDEVEALLRSAMNYVQASDDLRPRVLEAARGQRGEHRVLNSLRRVAVCVVIVGMLAPELSETFGVVVHRQPGHLAWTSSSEGIPTQDTAAQSDDRNWHEVESLTQLRRRQAEILRSAPGFGRRKA